MALSSKPVALITGASGGIGADLARVFAKNGHKLILVARSADKLEALATELAGKPGGRPLVMPLDLGKTGAVADLVKSISASGLEPSILVNNAGFGLNGRFAEIEVDEQLALIDLNIRALTALSHAFLPGILAAKGGILNVASIASFYPGPGMAVYYASKAFVLSFSEALAEELRGNGVTISALCPGPTRSNFFTRAGVAGGRYKGAKLMDAMAVAEAGYAGFIAGKRVILPGFQNKFMATLSHVIPNRIAMKFIARLQRSRHRK